MSRCFYQGTLDQFLKINEDVWLKQMQDSFDNLMGSTSNLVLSDSQVSAWKDCFDVLQRELVAFNKNHPGFSIIFEYILPYESGRRPDVILLSQEQVLILEFKRKAKGERADVDQCLAYKRDIENYHLESRDRDVKHALILTRAKNKLQRNSATLTPVISGDKVGEYLELEVAETTTTGTDVDKWCDSEYEPLPSLVRAAKAIMTNEPLPAIRRVNSTGIPNALESLSGLALQAKEKKEHIIAFVTGVPGAGKTYLGLQFVYNESKENERVNSVYLSGNASLIEVLSDALQSDVYIGSIHKVIGEFLSSGARDFRKNIIVFDEGQRAWDIGQMQLKGRSTSESEPDVMVRLCDERLDWCVLLILIGEGQEIYNGENSGITQWNEALVKSKKNWKVACPSKLLPVFEEDQEIINLDTRDCLDLTISLRSHVAEDTTKFVNSLLDGDISTAQSLVSSLYIDGYSMALTRDLEAAKQYCEQRYEDAPDARYGLIASSKDSILPLFGVNNSFNLEARSGNRGAWFNTQKGSGRSCCDFNLVMTEFDIQGLELDMPIVCWESDMKWNGRSWDKFRANEPSDADINVFRKNSYRVLLTRGRDGFVLFIPNEQSLDKLYVLLKEMGIREL